MWLPTLWQTQVNLLWDDETFRNLYIPGIAHTHSYSYDEGQIKIRQIVTKKYEPNIPTRIDLRKTTVLAIKTKNPMKSSACQW